MTALVRFTTRRRDGEAQPGPANYYAAVVTYDYSHAPLRVEDRLVNPLGFQVERYQRDDEVAPPPGSPSRSIADGNQSAHVGPPNGMGAGSVRPPRPTAPWMIGGRAMATRRGLLGACGALAAGCVPRPTWAAVLPKPGSRDPHVQTIDYEPDEVFLLRVALGYALTVEFSSDERIENVALGNSGVWQVMVNRRADHLFIKPMQGASETDLAVVTDTRFYNFQLEPLPALEPDMPFSLRFIYPAAIGDALAPQKTNAHYRFGGSRVIRPVSMEDDGTATYITWRADGPIPAIFVVNLQGKEALINGAMREGKYVVDQVGERFVFRLGDQSAQAVRIRNKTSP